MDYPPEIKNWISEAEHLAFDKKQAERSSFAAREAYHESKDVSKSLAKLGEPKHWIQQDTEKELRSIRKSILVFGMLAAVCAVYLVVRLLLILPFGSEPINVTHNVNIAVAGAGADLGAAVAVGILFIVLAVFRGFQYRTLSRKKEEQMP